MASMIQLDHIADFEGQDVTVHGWVYNRTDKGKLVFLLVRDGYGFAQCVAFKNDLDSQVFEQIMRIPQESAVKVTGTVRADHRAPEAGAGSPPDRPDDGFSPRAARRCRRSRSGPPRLRRTHPRLPWPNRSSRV